MCSFISEDGAVDAGLPAVVDEVPPDKEGAGSLCSEYDLFSGTNELSAFASICIVVAAVMPFVEFEAVKVAVLR